MKIVCLGGGHGLAQVLKAIKPLASNLTAIIATTDNGGSTGRLRHTQQCVALGDIRRCCLELVEDNSLLHTVFGHRFSGGELEGHSLGNLALLGLLQLTNSATEAVAQFNAILGNSQTVLPMSDEPVDLVATMQNGQTFIGECEIDALNQLPERICLTKPVNAHESAIKAINDADVVLIGPGSTISSVMPALLVGNIAHALQSTSACKIFVENISRENSVMAQLKEETVVNWLKKMVGYKFCDMSLSPAAIAQISNSALCSSHCAKHLHNIEQLHVVFTQLLLVKSD
ncbi:uridine diphosphate-N-acetylglucosamine-binding protein YvcK [Pseudoalteromonas sp. JBTF-M23]|uniref:Uridine diphosphate-N-acetylglucosamine-binding protein YvcK n=1 Tax=Pseudoalteromonas caenipelagi TaxID=2726988 RepID=A0A849V950_9GAMM|nr:uridine diphosphate-N-acetylglucosamine-binding protein YvcK [Pseudoalteromonas caenipelagi]NOU49163.1 uridine diphosphate-N-acetylglucosamine-binding protein YvcK [Pseudoalteromonas caenipelagi]